METLQPTENRDVWVTEMRKLFCPPEMVHEDGSLKTSYFRPKSTHMQKADWIQKSKNAVVKGIAKYGIGHWEEIQKEFIPMMGALEMELLVAALMGTDKLETYKDWKGTEEDIKVEHEKNTST